MNWCLAVGISRLCVENLGNSQLLPALFALIRKISSRHPSRPELIGCSLNLTMLLRSSYKHSDNKTMLSLVVARTLLVLACVMSLLDFRDAFAMPDYEMPCQTMGVEEEGITPAKRLLYRIVSKIPHDSHAFTQGLVFAGGYLYESTGIQGRSSLRMLNPETGEIISQIDLPHDHFGEGLTIQSGRLVQLTWQSGMASIYAPQNLEMTGYFHYAGEGWGVAAIPQGLLLSDGSHILRFLDFYGDETSERLAVSHAGQPLQGLNELELVNDILYANVWPGSCIAAIDLNSGSVLAWLDVSALHPSPEYDDHEMIANGIAYNNERNTFFVTGKYWPYLYEIALSEAGLH